MKITVDACKCDLCGHVWLPEKGEPERCAKCKRFGWNAGEKPKAVRTTGKNQKLKKQMKPRKTKPKVVTGEKATEEKEVETSAPLVELPAVSRECKLGAHAGCKGCECECHKK